jgi:SAM-dependent methyltransferase
VEEMLANDHPGLFAAIGELEWYSGSHRQWIDDQDLDAGDRVLEVGCATGALTSYLAGSGYRVIGLDNSADMISRAGSDHPQLEFVVGDATSLAYDDDAFDAVVAASVINVVDDAESVLSEMHRVCAPGGTVSVLVPSSGFANDDHDALIEALELTGFSEAALTKWHRGPPKMSRSQLEALFNGVGVVSVTTRRYLDGMLIAVSATAGSHRRDER